MRKRGDPERAIALSRLEGGLPAGFQRLYFGVEFCPWALPSTADYQAALAAARQAGWTFTLVLPVLAEAVLRQVQKLAADLAPGLREGDEILVSDFGAIPLVREAAPKVPVILGRVLSGQKRGPQILDLDLTPEPAGYFRQGRWHAAETVRLLAELGIHRVEQDHLLQGIAPLPMELCGSLHHPFAMVAASRNCPFQPAGGQGCEGGCGETFLLTTPDSGVPLLQGGNTQFFRHDQLPGNLTDLGIDRLVLHPRLPR